MKLIMENWSKFLKENEGDDAEWLDHIIKTAAHYVTENPGFNPATMGELTLEPLADAGAEIPRKYWAYLDTPLSRLFGADLEAATAEIMQTAGVHQSEDAETVAELRHLLTNPMYGST